MTDWISALNEMQARGQPCVLVTLVEDAGSTPRDAGAKMLVSADSCHDSIGGGELEQHAAALAREMLIRGERQPKLERIALGATLGQCCGGSILLLLEPLGQYRAEIVLFGAGHVGRALAGILAALPVRLHWIDSRPESFPPLLPSGIAVTLSEDPVDEVESLPPGCWYIVMTHSHALDEELCEAILRRGDFGWLGLIGSATKRARFEHRLRMRDIPEEALARLHCPIGIEGVQGKLPMEIAVAIAAALIAAYNAPAAVPPA